MLGAAEDCQRGGIGKKIAPLRIRAGKMKPQSAERRRFWIERHRDMVRLQTARSKRDQRSQRMPPDQFLHDADPRLLELGWQIHRRFHYRTGMQPTRRNFLHARTWRSVVARRRFTGFGFSPQASGAGRLITAWPPVRSRRRAPRRFCPARRALRVKEQMPPRPC